ncbi:hypothetical protein PJWF_00048 [Achromobacter phage JWF]|uniref:hypothetical protein n=1 Tax=Achromobacter phage JWF TaxID=1589748 RepID=UPI000588E447|nr:hypothetical protein AXJ13_gp048 [Achromobacter phage JWF]AJD82942.1 hypothetical protein PJWF_00048 [Achromobacter phage JWF]
MKADERFNKRASPLIEVNTFTVRSGAALAEGMVVELHELEGGNRDLRIHLTPKEAIALAMELLNKAHRKLNLIEGK